MQVATISWNCLPFSGKLCEAVVGRKRVLASRVEAHVRIIQFLDSVRQDDSCASRGVLELCRALAARDHSVTLITCDGTDVPEAWRHATLGFPTVAEIPPVNGPLKLLSRWSRKFLRSAIASTDLVHIHDAGDAAADHVAVLTRSEGKPFVLSTGGMIDGSVMGQGSSRILRFSRNSGNRGFGQSDVLALAQPRAASREVPLMFDLQAFQDLPHRGTCRTLLPGPVGAPAVGFAGDMHDRESVDRLIKATHILAAAGVLIHVYFAGPASSGDTSHLRTNADRQGLSGRVHYLRNVSGEQRIRMFRGCDMVILPSAHAGVSLTPFESLACGTPVITPRAGDTRSGLEECGGVLLSDSPSPTGIANAILTLVHHSERRLSMGLAGRRWAIEHLALDRTVIRFEKLYVDVIDRGAIIGVERETAATSAAG